MRVILARLTQHFRGTVQAHHLHTRRGYVSGQLSRAATEIQYPLALARPKQLQQAASEMPNVGVPAFVLLRVPRAQAFLPRAFPFWGFSVAAGSISDTASLTSSGVVPGTAAARTSLNHSAFLRSFLDGGASSLR